MSNETSLIDSIVKSAYTLLNNTPENEKQLFIQSKGIKDNLRKSLETVIDTGRRLIVIKEILYHGCFEEFVEKEFGFSKSSTSRFISVAKLFNGVENNTLSFIPASVAYQLIRKATPESVIARVVEQAKSGKKVSLLDVNGWIAKIAESEKIARLAASLPAMSPNKIAEKTTTPEVIVNEPNKLSTTSTTEPEINPKIDVNQELKKIQNSMSTAMTAIVEQVKKIKQDYLRIKQLAEDDYEKFCEMMQKAFDSDKSNADEILEKISDDDDTFIKYFFQRVAG